mgnify:CR=1 FL=1
MTVTLALPARKVPGAATLRASGSSVRGRSST